MTEFVHFLVSKINGKINLPLCESKEARSFTKEYEEVSCDDCRYKLKVFGVQINGW